MAYELTDEFLNELRSRVDIVELISRAVDLKPSASSFVGLCPFHNEKTPSFHVDPRKKFFYCFGCQTGGDAITYVMKTEGLSYPDAVVSLAERVGMLVPVRDTLDSGVTQMRKKILEMNRLAGRYFHRLLWEDVGKGALEYLVRRGLRKNTIIRFGLGYAPPGWHHLLEELRKKGYTEGEIKASGLVSVTEKGMFDRFRDRVMFPIIDQNGNVIGFGGRTMKDDPAKYLNTSENLIFRKGHNLYALNFAKASKDGELILCEGYMDVIALHQSGFCNAVATLGTALTPEQARLLKKYTDRVILCYDNDEAGINATRRGLEILSSVDLQVRVLTLRGGKDPDEIIENKGRDFFRTLLEESQNGLDYKLNRVLSRFDLSVDSERVQCASAVFDILAQVSSPAQTEIYAERAAKELNLSTDTVKREVARRKKKQARQREKKEIQQENNRLRGIGDRINPQRAAYPRAARAEEDILALMLNYPDRIGKLRKLVAPEDFVTDFNRRVFLALLEEADADPTRDPSVLLSRYFQPEEMGRIVSFLSSCEAIDAEEDKIRKVVETLQEEKRKITERAAGGERLLAENLKKLSQKYRAGHNKTEE